MAADRRVGVERVGDARRRGAVAAVEQGDPETARAAGNQTRRGVVAERDRGGARHAAVGLVARDVVQEGGIVEPNEDRRVVDLRHVIELRAARVVGRGGGRQIARVGRAGGRQRRARLAVGHAPREFQAGRHWSGGVDDRHVVAVDDVAIGGAVGVGPEDVQVISLALNHGDADASVAGRSHAAETVRSARGDHVAEHVEHLDVQVAAGGQERRAEQPEVELEIERAGLLGHSPIVILIGRGEAMLEHVGEDRLVGGVDRARRAEEGRGGPKIVRLVIVRTEDQQVRVARVRVDRGHQRSDVADIVVSDVGEQGRHAGHGAIGAHDAGIRIERFVEDHEIGGGQRRRDPGEHRVRAGAECKVADDQLDRVRSGTPFDIDQQIGRHRGGRGAATGTGRHRQRGHDVKRVAAQAAVDLQAFDRGVELDRLEVRPRGILDGDVPVRRIDEDKVTVVGPLHDDLVAEAHATGDLEGAPHAGEAHDRADPGHDPGGRGGRRVGQAEIGVDRVLHGERRGGATRGLVEFFNAAERNGVRARRGDRVGAEVDRGGGAGRRSVIQRVARGVGVSPLDANRDGRRTRGHRDVERVVPGQAAGQSARHVEDLDPGDDDAVERIAKLGAAGLARANPDRVVGRGAVEHERIGPAGIEEVHVGVVGQRRGAAVGHRGHREGTCAGRVVLVHRTDERAAVAGLTVEELDRVVARGAVDPHPVAVMLLDDDRQVLDAGEKDLRLWRVVVDDAARAHRGRLIAEIVEHSRDAIDDQRIAGGRVLAIDSDILQPAGRSPRGRRLVIQIDLITPCERIDDQMVLIRELVRLLIIDRDESGRTGAEDAAAWTLSVIDRIIGWRGINRDCARRHVVQHRGEVLEIHPLGHAAANNDVAAFSGIRANAIGVAGLGRSASLRQDQIIEAVAAGKAAASL